MVPALTISLTLTITPRYHNEYRVMTSPEREMTSLDKGGDVTWDDVTNDNYPRYHNEYRHLPGNIHYEKENPHWDHVKVPTVNDSDTIRYEWWRHVRGVMTSRERGDYVSWEGWWRHVLRVMTSRVLIWDCTDKINSNLAIWGQSTFCFQILNEDHIHARLSGSASNSSSCSDTTRHNCHL